jgi:acetyl esterase/lipase
VVAELGGSSIALACDVTNPASIREAAGNSTGLPAPFNPEVFMTQSEAFVADQAPDAQRDGILVAEHFVPTPKSISPEAQAFLRFKPPLSAPAIPSTRDPAVWKAFRDAGDMAVAMMSAAYVEKYPADVVERRLSHSTLYEIAPRDLAPDNEKRAILYVHGGGFVAGGGVGAVNLGIQMAGLARVRVFSSDYRLAPENPFPAPLDDVVEAYRFVLETHRPQDVAIVGASAGANLAPACILKARDLGLPMPGACGMLSCPSDMGDQGDSAYANVEIDTVLQRGHPQLSDAYAQEHDRRDPHLSPVYADFSTGFPPSVLISGTRDILLSGTVRLHRAMVRGGVKAELHVWEAMTHMPFLGAPEEHEVYDQLTSFVLTHMGRD